MANIQSAKKRARQTITRTERNVARRGRVRTFIKKVETSLLGTDGAVAAAALKAAQPEIMRGVTKGIMNKKTASRKISRLAARVKKLALA